MKGRTMEVIGTYEVLGQNRLYMGEMDEYGVVRKDGKIVLRVEHGLIYSVHGSYMGRCKNGVGKSDHGQLIFTLRLV
ncbi:hypothetical protein SAMN05421724_0476 [Pseudomonas syringae]|nr:hypothetical protein SAMN05421724_0476 [Pseudomonas syringae]